jgi:plasmid stabilization system protein ParE
MAKARLTEEARTDLEDIYFEMSQNSDAYAQNWADEFFHQIELLEKFPYLGKMYPDVSIKPFREIIVGKYKVFYAVSEEEIWVLGVKHSSF